MRRTILAASMAAATALVALSAQSLSPSTLSSPPVGSASVTAPAVDSAEQSDRAIGIERMDIRGRAKTTTGATRVTPITYHNGPIITGTTNVYYIWYGAWSTNPTGAQILTDFASSLGGSPYFAINTSYTNSAKVAVSNSVTLAGSTSDAYSQGTTLSDAAVKTVVSTAITGGKLPKDANGVYVVLTSADVKESSGFVTRYCGWHGHATIATTDIKYSFVGDPTTQGLANCAWQTASSPNANPGADAMVSVVAHEIEEAVTDPDPNAWYDASGAENADKCAWTFGTTYRATNGSLANMKLGARDYLVQQNWKAGTVQGCALSA
jgi:hypothetical protein